MKEPEIREQLRLNRLIDLEKAAHDYHFAVESGSAKKKLSEGHLMAAAFLYAQVAHERIGTVCEKCPWVSKDKRDQEALTPAVLEAAAMGQDFVCHTRMTRCWGAYIYRENLPVPSGQGMTLKDLAGAAEALAAAHGDLPVEVRGPEGESGPMSDLRAERRGAGKKQRVVVFLDTAPP